MEQEEKPCDCGWLGLCLNERNSPVMFDAEANTLFFVGSDQSRWSLYYCPMCGGKFPDSNFCMDVPIASDGEYERLEQLVKGLNTAESAIEKLGQPDYDGLMKTYQRTSDGYAVDETQAPTRNVEYYNLSDWFTIEFYFFDDTSETRINPKALNARQLQKEFDHPAYPDSPIVGDLDDEFLGDCRD